MHIMKGQKTVYPVPKDTKLLFQKQVEAFYQNLMSHVGMVVKVPIPLREKGIPSDEDYKNSESIWKETHQLLSMMGIKHTTFPQFFGIRIDE